MKKEHAKQNKLLCLSWLPWILILFEMLYMATPFAVFFYSAYKMPLKLLNSSGVGSWFVQTVFPHFVETEIPMLHSAMEISWVVMAIALLVFFAAFFQIYYAKFTKKGMVSGGIYKIIRHPQYTAWTIFGFGMCIVWSRLIVWVMFVTMTMIYYFLARAEERECFTRYKSYLYYYNSTGMFFPKIFQTKLSSFFWPHKMKVNILSVLIVYLAVLSGTILTARVTRNWIIEQMTTTSGDGYMVLSLTGSGRAHLDDVVATMCNDPEINKMFMASRDQHEKLIIYSMPQKWEVSELGISKESDAYESGDDPHMNPRSHGNPADTEPWLKKVLISKAVLNTPACADDKILHHLKAQRPVRVCLLDLRTKRVTANKKVVDSGRYGDIPVPLF